MVAEEKKTFLIDEETNQFSYWCPGCSGYHSIELGTNHILLDDKPTIDGQIIKSTLRPKAGKRHLCVHVIKNGRMYFHSKSGHSLAGKFIDMEKI